MGSYVHSPPWGRKLVGLNWTLAVAVWEQETSPVAFLSLFVFFTQSFLMQGVWQGSPSSWAVKGMSQPLWGGRTAGQGASCWNWLHRSTAAPVGGPSAASGGDLCRVFRGRNLSTIICVVWGSFTYLLCYVDEAWIWGYYHIMISISME